jgi:hypothetical protein
MHHRKTLKKLLSDGCHKGNAIGSVVVHKGRTKQELARMFKLLTSVWQKMQAKNLGLEDAHHENIIVMLNSSGGVQDVKLIDFGHARTD